MSIFMNFTGNSFPGGSYQIEILDFSFGVANTGTASSGGGGSGKVKFNEFSFVRTSDKASPLFFKFCCSGVFLPAVQLTLDTAGAATPYLQITLKTVLITSFQTSSGGDTPTESLTLEYEEIEYETLDANGDVEYEAQFDATWGQT